MLRINTFALYTLGKQLQPIESIDEDKAVFGEVMWPLWHARSQVRSLLANSALPIRASRNAATQLSDAIDKVVSTDIQDAIKEDKKTKINWYSIRQIKDAATKLETILAEELAIIDTYSVSQKGAYSTTELISNADVMFSKSIREKLPLRAINDIKEAGKCLALETPTAAGFHIVRAIESVILVYFESVMGRKPPNRMRNWSVYIKTLRDSGKADAKILDFLTHIKDNYRNPVSHPEAVLSVEEVIVLVGVSVGAITQMAMVI